MLRPDECLSIKIACNKIDMFAERIMSTLHSEDAAIFAEHIRREKEAIYNIVKGVCDETYLESYTRNGDFVHVLRPDIPLDSGDSGNDISPK